MKLHHLVKDEKEINLKSISYAFKHFFWNLGDLVGDIRRDPAKKVKQAKLKIRDLPFDIQDAFEYKKAKREIDKIIQQTTLTPKGLLYLKVSSYLTIAGLGLLCASYAPSIWYYITDRFGLAQNTRYIADTALASTDVQAQIVRTFDQYQPPKDATLPTVNRLIMRSAGIDTQIHEAPFDNHEEALRKGVWRVDDFGTPFDRSLPTILSAHRFGYLKWSIPYRLKNSFYNLPKLKVGDTVEVVWNQRKYVYSVYGEGEGTEITDYNADLILYTCKDLKSDIRIFKYLDLIEL